VPHALSQTKRSAGVWHGIRRGGVYGR
jgi:hypothetical protein